MSFNKGVGNCSACGENKEGPYNVICDECFASWRTKITKYDQAHHEYNQMTCEEYYKMKEDADKWNSGKAFLVDGKSVSAHDILKWKDKANQWDSYMNWGLISKEFQNNVEDYNRARKTDVLDHICPPGHLCDYRKKRFGYQLPADWNQGVEWRIRRIERYLSLSHQ